MSAYAERVLAERNKSFTNDSTHSTRGEHAIHEAGHVVALEEAGVSWVRVFLPDDHPDLGGRVESRRPSDEKLLRVLLAGRMAVSILCGEDDDEEQIEWLDGLSYGHPDDWETEETDDRTILDHVSQLPDEVDREALLRSEMEWVRATLTERWPDLLRLAEALDREGHLTDDEARAILGREEQT